MKLSTLLVATMLCLSTALTAHAQYTATSGTPAAGAFTALFGGPVVGTSYVIDGGFFQAQWGFPPDVEVYPNNQPNDYQQFNFVPSDPSGARFTICDVHDAACLTDAGSIVDIGQGKDIWLVVAVGNSRWSLNNIRTGHFMGAIPSVSRGNVPMTATAMAEPLTIISGTPPTPTPTPTGSGTPTPRPTPTPTATPTSTTTPTPVPGAAVKANDFLNSLGAVTHDIQGIDGAGQIEAAVQYTGVRNIRDDATHASGKFAELCAIHAATGAMVDEISVVDSGSSSVTDSITQYEALAACGAMLAAEGANEPNNFPFTYGTSCSFGGSFDACAHHQIDLYKAVHADPKLAGKAVWAETEPGIEPDNQGLQYLTIPSGAGALQPDGTVYADFANLHNYAIGNGQSVAADNQAWFPESTGASFGPWDGMDGEFLRSTWRSGFTAAPLSAGPAMPKVTTETGWPDTLSNQDQQGKLLVNLYLSATKLGWSNTFVYLMFEDGSRFGLYEQNSSPTSPVVPKLAATYIHDLTGILNDTSSAFTPGTVGYSIASEPATVHDLLMQKSNGTYELAVWDDRPVGEGSDSVVVNLGGSYPTVSVYDITVGTAPVQTLSNASSVPLTMTDHAFVVEF